MAITYFDEISEYVTNHFRLKHFKDGFLLTTDHGSWVFLSKEEYTSFISGKSHEDPQLFNLLNEKGFVITNNNIDRITDSYKQRYSFLSNGAYLHTILVKDGNAVMNSRLAEQTTDFIFQSPSKRLEIEFKDDLLSDFGIIRHIVDYSKKLAMKLDKKIIFRLVSNLKGMNNKIFEYMIGENFHITTFLDGPKEIHEQNKKYVEGNNYDALSSWIDKIRKRYRIYLVPRITKFSLGNPKEIIDEYIRLNQNQIPIMPLSIARFDEKWNELGYKADEFVEFWKKAVEYLIQINSSREFKEELAAVMLRNILQKQGTHHRDFTSPHGAVISNLAYMPDGSVFPLDEAAKFEVFKLGTVFEKYSDVVVSLQSAALIRASMNDYSIIDSNAYKPYLSTCSACSYAKGRNIIPRLPDFRYNVQVGILDYLFEKIIFDENYRKIFLKWAK